MTAKIQLWLRNYLFQETKIEVPEYDCLSNFEDRCDMRQQFLKLKAQEMTALFHPQINKCEGKFQIYVIIESKMNLIHEEKA